MERKTGQLPADVRFRYQKDLGFQSLVDYGIGRELSNSGYCWAACLDMALSPFIPDDLVRDGIIANSVRDQRLGAESFTENGELSSEKIEDLVNIINENLTSGNLQTELKLVREQGLNDFHLELQKGRTVIFGMHDETGGHVMVMDRVYQDGGKYIYATYDPAIEDPLKARKYFDNFQLYGQQMYSDSKIIPFIISVGVK